MTIPCLDSIHSCHAVTGLNAKGQGDVDQAVECYHSNQKRRGDEAFGVGQWVMNRVQCLCATVEGIRQQLCRNLAAERQNV